MIKWNPYHKQHQQQIQVLNSLLTILTKTHKKHYVLLQSINLPLRCNFFLFHLKTLILKIPINGPNIIIEDFNIHMLTQSPPAPHNLHNIAKNL